MDLASGPFYTSPIFWAVIGVAAALLVGVATMWVTWLSPYPKRRLYCWMPAATPGMPADIEVRCKVQDKPPENPHVVTVELTSTGRFDIDRTAFDGGDPLRLDVGAPIVKCVEITTRPTDRMVPPHDIDGSVLLVRPALIRMRQRISFSLLVDGPSPQLGPPIQSLRDVDIQWLDPRTEARRQWVVFLATLAGTLLAVTGVSYLILRNRNTSPVWLIVAAIPIVMGSLIAVALSTRPRPR